MESIFIIVLLIGYTIETCLGASLELIDGGKYCTFDKIKFEYSLEISSVGNMKSAWGIGVFDDTTKELIHRIPIKYDGLDDWETHQNKLKERFESYSSTIPVVGCEVLSEWEPQESHCGFDDHWPKLVKVEASPGYGPGSKIRLFLDRNTNQPDVSTDELVRSVVNFSQPIGKEIIGAWLNPKVLEITVINDEGTSEYHNGDVTVKLQQRSRNANETQYASLNTMLTPNLNDTISIRGIEAIRLGYPATVYLELYGLDKDQALAISPVLVIEKCDDVGMVVMHESTPSNKKTPVWEIVGTVVMPDAVTLPRFAQPNEPIIPDDVPISIPAYSISFWVSLEQFHSPCDTPSAPRFRSLLYHGHGQGHENGARTVSLWLLPDENILTMRISTFGDNDVGAIANSYPLQHHTWYHVALVVDNTTETFSSSLFLDGERVLHLEQPANRVIPSIGKFHLGHDAWGVGPQGFLKNVRYFDYALGRLDLHRQIAQDGEALTSTAMITPALSSMDADTDICPTDPVTNLELAQVDGGDASAATDNDPDAIMRMVRDQGAKPSKELLHRAVIQLHPESLYYEALISRIGRFLPISSEPATQLEPFDRKGFVRSMELAALRGSLHAKLVLANEYRLDGECMLAATYYRDVAEVAFQEHTRGGSQTLVEMQILSDFVEESGERGDDDEKIQYQIMRAEQGDVPALLDMGQVYYWGSHGMQRDFSKAYQYFKRAAQTGNAVGQTACGNLLLKGEGVERNVTKALEYYHLAAGQDNLEALNGLGYIYYFGQAGVEKNVTKALEYFERNLRDGDSLANAAHIYLHEVSLRNVDRAVEYFERAAVNFNSFVSHYHLGEIHFRKTNQCHRSLRHLRHAALHGSWGRILRSGFDSFLERDFEKATFQYLEAAILGYTRGAENVAWLLHNKLQILAQGPYEELFDLLDDNVLPLQQLLVGEIYMKQGNEAEAIRQWVSASVNGDLGLQKVYRSQASYNLGMLAMKHQDYKRADRYFQRAKHFVAEDDDSDQARAVRAAVKIATTHLSITETLNSYSTVASYSYLQIWQRFFEP